MKIEGVRPVSYVDPVKNARDNHLAKGNKQDDKPLDEAVKYEPSEKQESVTYSKPGHVYDKVTVDKLKAQSKQAYSYLRNLVEQLVLKQGHSIKTISAEDWANIEIDDETRSEAQSLIDPGGPLSPEAVSDRLVDFAKAISGGDVSKLKTLKEAIEKGFKEAESLLGELPEISKQTYRLVMEKLDAWANESADLEDINE